MLSQQESSSPTPPSLGFLQALCHALQHLVFGEGRSRVEGLVSHREGWKVHR